MENKAITIGKFIFRLYKEATYVCPSCGSLVAENWVRRHVDWHKKEGK